MKLGQFRAMGPFGAPEAVRALIAESAPPDPEGDNGSANHQVLGT